MEGHFRDELSLVNIKRVEIIAPILLDTTINL